MPLWLEHEILGRYRTIAASRNQDLIKILLPDDREMEEKKSPIFSLPFHDHRVTRSLSKIRDDSYILQLPFVTPEDIFCGVAHWLDHVMAGDILIARAAWRYATVCEEALNVVNVANEASFPLRLCHAEEQPGDRLCVRCCTGCHNTALRIGKFPQCSYDFAATLSVEPGWTGRVDHVCASISFEEGEGSL